MNRKLFAKGLAIPLLLFLFTFSMTGCQLIGGFPEPVVQEAQGPDLAATAAAEATRIVADAQAAAAQQQPAQQQPAQQQPAQQADKPTDVPPTEEPAEEPAASGKVLVVGEDQLSGHYEWTSADEIADALRNLGYTVDTWGTWDEGFPNTDTLNMYDAIFWTTGDDCCDSPPIDGVNAIKSYLDQGGKNLSLTGSSIAYAYPNSTFLKNYVGVNHYGWNPLADLQMENHPLAAGMSGNIDLDEPSGIRPDIVTAYAGTQPVAVRGPSSAGAGQLMMTTYEFDGNKVFFSAVPLQWLPAPQLKILLGNMMDWFLG